MPQWLLARIYIPATAKAPTHEGASALATPSRVYPHLLLLVFHGTGRPLLRAVVTILWG